MRLSAKRHRGQDRLGAAGRQRDRRAASATGSTRSADDIAALRAHGQEVIVVSSGAIALGRHVLELPTGALRLEESRPPPRSARSPRPCLSGCFRAPRHHRRAGAAHPRRHRGAPPLSQCAQHARRPCSLGAVPVINENDTVATSEIRYGDNDRLAARVAAMMSADCLVLLSDIDGLYTAARRDPDAERLDRSRATSRPRSRPWPAMPARAVARRHGDQDRGGQASPSPAGRHGDRRAAGAAIRWPRSRRRRACTWFLSAADPVAARKRWIAGTLEPQRRA